MTPPPLRFDRKHRHLARSTILLGLCALVLAVACSRAAPRPVAESAAAAAGAAGSADVATDDTADRASAVDDASVAVDGLAADASTRGAPARRPRSLPPAIIPGPARVVAIGDVHGDITQMRKALRLAGAIDKQDKWIGGKLVVVQVGDQLDRGDDEKAILLLLEAIADQAYAAGGALLALIGNHETMNVARQFGYVTPGGWVDFADVPHVPSDALLASYPQAQRGRVSAFRPGGPYATLLSSHNTIQVVGDTVFVHGGVLPKHVARGVAKINAEIGAWMSGKGPKPASVSGADSPVWSRHYSLKVDAADCALAAQTVKALGVKRIVVAHTVQAKGINAVCGGMVWRVDVGLAKHYGGKPQVLVVEGGKVSVKK